MFDVEVDVLDVFDPSFMERLDSPGLFDCPAP